MASVLRIIILAWLCIGGWHLADGQCLQGWHEEGAYCYYFSTERDHRQYEEAQRVCEGWNSDLTSVTEANYVFITKTWLEVSSGQCRGDTCSEEEERQMQAWIGLHQATVPDFNLSLLERKQGWAWEDGESYHPSYDKWFHSVARLTDWEPSGGVRCARMQRDGSWADKECSASYRYICKATAQMTRSAVTGAKSDPTTTTSPTTSQPPVMKTDEATRPTATTATATIATTTTTAITPMASTSGHRHPPTLPSTEASVPPSTDAPTSSPTTAGGSFGTDRSTAATLRPQTRDTTTSPSTGDTDHKMTVDTMKSTVVYSDVRLALIVGVTLGVLVLLLLISNVILLYCCCSHRRDKTDSEAGSSQECFAAMGEDYSLPYDDPGKTPPGRMGVPLPGLDLVGKGGSLYFDIDDLKRSIPPSPHALPTSPKYATIAEVQDLRGRMKPGSVLYAIPEDGAEPADHTEVSQMFDYGVGRTGSAAPAPPTYAVPAKRKSADDAGSDDGDADTCDIVDNVVYSAL